MTGQTISHYRILDKIGEGGMGVVYKAQDTRLDRFVALKILPPDKIANHVRKHRFVQEAKSASALNHPNIVTVYDIGSADGVDFIAMEYVAGKTLEELIPSKGMRLSEVLKIAVQVADALATAHQAGIIHRDLKPGNIIVGEDGRARVLDFGLAKLTETDPESDETVTAIAESGPRTEEGTILGTARYMSPEQAEGRRVDARSDIFSFGSVLYEMVTGRRAFRGDTTISTLAAIIHGDPEPLPAEVPSGLGKIVFRCLRKDLARRSQHMADVKIALEDAKEEITADTGQQTTRMSHGQRRPSVWIVVLVVCVAVALGALLFRSTNEGPGPLFHLTRLTADSGLTFQPAISPDGTLTAYASDRPNGGDLDIWVQQTAGGRPIQLTDNETDDYEPAFSPDGSKIAFRSDRAGGGIFIVPALGGESRLLVAQGHEPRFSPGGERIAYRSGDRVVGTELFTVDLETGAQQRVALEFADSDQRFCYGPIWTRTGEHLLFATGNATSVEDWWTVPATGGTARNAGIADVLDRYGLSQAVPEGMVGEDSIIFSAVEGSSGRESLWRIRFSPEQLAVVGAPAQLTFGSGTEVQASVSTTGQIAFASREHITNLWSVPIRQDQGDVTGELQSLTQGPAAVGWPSASADGNMVAYVFNRSGRNEFASSNNEIQLLDLRQNTLMPLTASTPNQQNPVLSHEGAFLVYEAVENGQETMYMSSTKGGLPQNICNGCGHPRHISSDGKIILTDEFASPSSIAILDVDERSAKEILKSPVAALFAPQFSGDDRWIAFHARALEDQRRRIFVAPYRGGSEIDRAEWVEITEGSSDDSAPHWSSNGESLYFLSDRDGFQCLWAQRLDAATKKPIGAATPVFHFHSAGLSATSIRNPGIIGPAVTRDKIVLTLAETTGNIWVMDPANLP